MRILSMWSDQQVALLTLMEKGYWVDKGGAIHSPHNGIINGCVNTTGYLYITLRMGSFYGCRKCCKVPVHRVVAYQKYGDGLFQDGIEVRHLNNNKLDNSHDNVVIGTHSENFYDLPEKDRARLAELGARKVRKFDEDTINTIRLRHDSGDSYRVLMKDYGIAKSTLSYIINRRTYAKVGL